MDFLIEFITELILEGTFELSKNKKTPKWLRYPLIILVSLFFIAIILIIFITGYLALKEIPLLGIFLILLSLIFSVLSINKFKTTYIKRNPNSQYSKLWTDFIEQICTQKIEFLNEIQKNAVLCFYYDREMNIGGHICYFDNYPKIKNEDLEKALNIVANKKYAKNFKKAILQGKENNYENEDKYYLELSPCLTEYLEEYVINNQENIFPKK